MSKTTLQSLRILSKIPISSLMSKEVLLGTSWQIHPNNIFACKFGGCSFLACKWKLPAYCWLCLGAFKLTIGALHSHLTFEACVVTVEAFSAYN